jgi:hypothetical protein
MPRPEPDTIATLPSSFICHPERSEGSARALGRG